MWFNILNIQNIVCIEELDLQNYRYIPISYNSRPLGECVYHLKHLLTREKKSIRCNKITILISLLS